MAVPIFPRGFHSSLLLPNIAPFPPHVARHVDTISGASIHCRTSHCCGWNRYVELVSHTWRPISPFGLLGLRRYALLGQTMGRL